MKDPKSMRWMIPFFSFLLLSQTVSAQTDAELLIQFEQYIENMEQDGDYPDLEDRIHYNLYNKPDLNTIGPFDLLSFKVLYPNQIKEIIRHRIEFGAFISLLELQTIDSIPLQVVMVLSQLVTINDMHWQTDNLWQQLEMAKKELIGVYSTSTPLSKGYTSFTKDSMAYYPGAPYAFRLRLRTNFKNRILFGISGDKDEGENFFSWPNPQGFDFYSAHLFIRKTNRIKKMAFGDFQADFGQGLTMSGGLGFGKSALVLNVKRTGHGLRPYRSFNENEFLRGTGITLGYKKFEFTGFVSRLKIDAFTDITSFNDREIIIRSFSTDGNHRTTTELNKKNKITKTLIGHNLGYKHKNLTVGITGIFNSFDKPISIDDKVYNRFYFSGKDYVKVGIDGDCYYKNINIFAEAVTGTNQANGYIIGLLMSVGRYIDLALAGRYYSKTFIWYNTTGFSENSNPVNERGMYSGIQIKLTKRVLLSGYIDRFQLPWYSFTTDGRGKGIDFLSELNYKPNKTSQFYIRFRTKQELKNSALENYHQLIWTDKTSLRIHSELKISPAWVIKTRAEFSRFKAVDNHTSLGNLIFIDLAYKKQFSPLSFSSRIVWFNTSDYDSRIYTVENDVMNAWSVPGFSGSGSKIYLLVKYKLSGKIGVQCRVSSLNYFDRKSIGSGYDKVDSNCVHQINILLSYGFM